MTLRQMTLRQMRLLGLAVSAPAFAMAMLLASIHTPRYSHWRDTVSRLGSPGQPWAPFVRAAFIIYGLVVLVGAGAARSRHLRPETTPLLYTYAVAATVAGLAPKDLPGARHTTTSTVHVVATLVGGAAVIAAMVVTAVATSSRAMRLMSTVAALATITAAVAFRFTWGSRYYGAIERAVLVPALLWISGVAVAAWRQPTGGCRVGGWCGRGRRGW